MLLKVPHGSILGPILFLLYANSLPRILTDRCAELHADDISLICSGYWSSIIEDIVQGRY